MNGLIKFPNSSIPFLTAINLDALGSSLANNGATRKIEPFSNAALQLDLQQINV
jgi:hypothetical protein